MSRFCEHSLQTGQNGGNTNWMNLYPQY